MIGTDVRGLFMTIKEKYFLGHQILMFVTRLFRTYLKPNHDDGRYGHEPITASDFVVMLASLSIANFSGRAVARGIGSRFHDEFSGRPDVTFSNACGDDDNVTSDDSELLQFVNSTGSTYGIRLQRLDQVSVLHLCRILDCQLNKLSALSSSNGCLTCHRENTRGSSMLCTCDRNRQTSDTFRDFQDLGQYSVRSLWERLIYLERKHGIQLRLVLPYILRDDSNFEYSWQDNPRQILPTIIKFLKRSEDRISRLSKIAARTGSYRRRSRAASIVNDASPSQTSRPNSSESRLNDRRSECISVSTGGNRDESTRTTLLSRLSRGARKIRSTIAIGARLCATIPTDSHRFHTKTYHVDSFDSPIQQSRLQSAQYTFSSVIEPKTEPDDIPELRTSFGVVQEISDNSAAHSNILSSRRKTILGRADGFDSPETPPMRQRRANTHNSGLESFRNHESNKAQFLTHSLDSGEIKYLQVSSRIDSVKGGIEKNSFRKNLRQDSIASPRKNYMVSQTILNSPKTDEEELQKVPHLTAFIDNANSTSSNHSTSQGLQHNSVDDKNDDSKMPQYYRDRFGETDNKFDDTSRTSLKMLNLPETPPKTVGNTVSTDSILTKEKRADSAFTLGSGMGIKAFKNRNSRLSMSSRTLHISSEERTTRAHTVSVPSISNSVAHNSQRFDRHVRNSDAVSDDEYASSGKLPGRYLKSYNAVENKKNLFQTEAKDPERANSRSKTFLEMVDALPDLMTNIFGPSPTLSNHKSLYQNFSQNSPKPAEKPSFDIATRMEHQRSKKLDPEARIITALLLPVQLAESCLSNQSRQPMLFFAVRALADVQTIGSCLSVCKMWRNVLSPRVLELTQHAAVCRGIDYRIRASVYLKFARAAYPVYEESSADNTSGDYLPEEISITGFQEMITQGKTAQDAAAIGRDVPRAFGRAAPHKSSSENSLLLYSKTDIDEEDSELWEQTSIEQKREALANVLYAFVGHKSVDGYCQGQERIIGHLMQMCNRNKAKSSDFVLSTSRSVFELFSCLYEGYGLRQMYDVESGGMLVCVETFTKMVEAKLPMIHMHFQRLDFSLDMVAFGWFQTLYCNTLLPKRTISRLFDWWITSGDLGVFFRFGLALLKANETALLSCNFDEIATFLNSFPNSDCNKAETIIPIAREIPFFPGELMCVEGNVRQSNGYSVYSSNDMLLRAGPFFGLKKLGDPARALKVRYIIVATHL